MALFQLFRLKVVRRSQRSLFDGDQSGPAILRQIIVSNPSAKLGRSQWQIGNVTTIDSQSVHFLFGRTTRMTIPTYDPERFSFVDSDLESAPHTEVVVDFDIEVGAIASNTQLGQTVSGVARRLAKL